MKYLILIFVLFCGCATYDTYEWKLDSLSKNIITGDSSGISPWKTNYDKVDTALFKPQMDMSPNRNSFGHYNPNYQVLIANISTPEEQRLINQRIFDSTITQSIIRISERYVLECYNDTILTSINFGEEIPVHHHKPTFEGFIEFLKKGK